MTTQNHSTDTTALHHAITSTTSRTPKYFFIAASLVIIIIALLGFMPSYQEADIYPIHWFAHIHGSLMSGWLILFATQSLLASRGMIRFHKQLGLWSVGLGILVWISMWIASARALIGYNPPVGHFLYDVLIMQFYGILLFGLFFTWAIISRHNRVVHKRLIYFATFIIIQAAIDRMHWLPGLHANLYVRFVYLNLFIVALMGYDFISQKKIYPITWIATAITIATQAGVSLIWGSGAWHAFWFNVVNSL